MCGTLETEHPKNKEELEYRSERSERGYAGKILVFASAPSVGRSVSCLAWNFKTYMKRQLNRKIRQEPCTLTSLGMKPSRAGRIRECQDETAKHWALPDARPLRSFRGATKKKVLPPKAGRPIQSESDHRVLWPDRFRQQRSNWIEWLDQFNYPGIFIHLERIIQIWIECPFHGIQRTLQMHNRDFNGFHSNQYWFWYHSSSAADARNSR